MADVYTYLFISLGVLISFPALLVAINLLFPQLAEGVQTRLAETPGKSCFLGIPVLCAFALAIAITTSAAGPFATLGYIAGIIAFGISCVGMAGMARLLADRISKEASPNSKLTHLVRGAVVFELACLFPIVGWLLFLPLTIIGTMGAATFSLLRWLPKRSNQSTVNGEQSTLNTEQSIIIH